MAETQWGFSNLVGLEVTEMAPGFSRGVLTVRDELLNPYGLLHGAALYTMADTGMGAAMYHELDGDQRCATIEVKINYLRPVASGEVVCETRLVQSGTSVAFLVSELEHDDDIVAHATGSYSVYTPGDRSNSTTE